MRRYLKDGSSLWLGLVLLIAVSIAFLLPVVPEDYWWYMRIGQQTLAAHAVPTTDFFTYSVAGEAVYYHSWGASVLFWLIYKVGGLSLTVLLRGIIVLLTYGLIWFTGRRLGAGKLGSSLILLLVVLASSNNWVVRPQIMAYPLFALTIYLLYRWQNGERRLVWFLPLIAFIWGNLHASYVMMLFLMLAALVFGKWDRKHLLLAFILSLAVLLINPGGWQTYHYIFTSLTSASNQNYSAEWSAPVNQGWQMNIFFLWLLLFPLLAVFSKKKLSGMEWAWFAGFGFMALWGLRYVIWFELILAILTMQLLADWEARWLPEKASGNAIANAILPTIMILASLALLPGIREKWWKDAPEVTDNTPVAAVQYLQAHPELKGPLFSELSMASYLEFALPDWPVWIDSRVYPFPEQMMADYKEINYAYWDWQPRLDATGAKVVLVSKENQPRLVKAIQTSNEWCPVYDDSIAQIYVSCAGTSKP